MDDGSSAPAESYNAHSLPDIWLAADEVLRFRGSAAAWRELGEKATLTAWFVVGLVVTDVMGAGDVVGAADLPLGFLEGTAVLLVVLDVQDMTSGRWICRTKGGEQLRIFPEKLVPLAETGQKFSRLRYDAS